jgi:hypothetical protein
MSLSRLSDGFGDRQQQDDGTEGIGMTGMGAISVQATTARVLELFKGHG